VRSLALVVLYSVAWAAFGVASGWVAHRAAASRFDHDTWLTRPRRWEHAGRWYDRRLRVRYWKDRLPEAGALFAGGWAKDRLRSFELEHLERFAAETRRAEWVHWANIAFGVSFVVWAEPVVAVVMTVFGVVVHLPFVVVQRYNRARLLSVIANSRRRRMHPNGSARSKHGQPDANRKA